MVAVAVLIAGDAPCAGAAEPRGDDGAGAETSGGLAEAVVGGEVEAATAGHVEQTESAAAEHVKGSWA